MNDRDAVSVTIAVMGHAGALEEQQAAAVRLGHVAALRVWRALGAWRGPNAALDPHVRQCVFEYLDELGSSALSQLEPDEALDGQDVWDTCRVWGEARGAISKFGAVNVEQACAHQSAVAANIVCFEHDAASAQVCARIARTRGCCGHDRDGLAIALLAEMDEPDPLVALQSADQILCPVG